MLANNKAFLEVIEWFDPTGHEIVHRVPEQGSGDIKYGAQLTVRESQIAVFFYKGKALHAFPAGRHSLKTANIPLLTKILSAPWGFESPLRAEVYFVNIKVFTNLKWGTRDPVAFKDDTLGLIRLRAFGQFNIQVIQPLLFINSLLGTFDHLETADVEEYLSRVIVSRFNDYLGEHLKTIFDLPGRYNEWAEGLKLKVSEDFAHFGLAMTDLYINSITPPPEVQKAIDDRSRLGVFDDLNQLMQMKAAMALEKAAEQPGGAGEGLAMGLGLMMPAMMSQFVQVPDAGARSGKCPDCGLKVPGKASFCPFCGHQLMVFQQCVKCGKNLAPNARFCSHCGAEVHQALASRNCDHCGAENLLNSVFCNQCGERL